MTPADLRTFDTETAHTRTLTVAGPAGWVDLALVRLREGPPWSVTGVHYRHPMDGETDALGKRYQDDLSRRWQDAGATPEAAYELLAGWYRELYGGAR